MARVVFYEKPGCQTNARQKALLAAAGHIVRPRNLLAEPWTSARLKRFFGRRPVADWFNRAAPRVKSGEIDPKALTPSAALETLAADPLLIRRPLMEIDGALTVGFDADEIDAWIGLAARDEGEALEDCRKRDAPCSTSPA
jgi:nitrogenase-associated protein